MSKSKQKGKEWLNINQLPAITYELSVEIPRLLTLEGLFLSTCHLTAVGFDEHGQDDFKGSGPV